LAQAAEQVVFNPNIGKYDVEVDVGPAFATKRQEQFAALSQIASQNKEVMSVAGDLIFQAADFPMAEELAERMRRTIPPAILGEDDGQQAQTQQLRSSNCKSMQMLMGTMAQKLADKDAELNLKQRPEVDRRLRRRDAPARGPQGLSPRRRSGRSSPPCQARNQRGARRPPRRYVASGACRCRPDAGNGRS
jgi:hypothetical protein